MLGRRPFRLDHSRELMKSLSLHKPSINLLSSAPCCCIPSCLLYISSNNERVFPLPVPFAFHCVPFALSVPLRSICVPLTFTVSFAFHISFSGVPPVLVGESGGRAGRAVPVLPGEGAAPVPGRPDDPHHAAGALLLRLCPAA